MALKLGILGDSGADSFRGTDNRGGSYAATTFGPTDLLARFRGFDVGTWGTYAEPRRIDYAYNWARSAAETVDMATQGQVSGLVAQIEAASADDWYVYVRIGANDFAYYSTSFYQPVYAGTLTGSALASEITTRVNAVLDAADDLIAAGAKGVILRDVPGLINGSNTNETSIARVQAALETFNSSLAAGAASRDSAKVCLTVTAELQQMAVTTNSGHAGIWFGNAFLNFDTTGDEPHNWLLSDAIHSGTVINAYEANAFVLWPLRRYFGLQVQPFSHSEMWSIAGVASATIRGSLVRS
jgi:hypothetical protein